MDEQPIPSVTPAPPAVVPAQRVTWRPEPDDPKMKGGYVGTFCPQDAATMCSQLNDLHAGRRTYKATPITAS